jgi:serine/threonine-protein kinase
MRTTQPLRVLSSPQGPIFKPDFEKIAYHRTTKAVPKTGSKPVAFRVPKGFTRRPDHIVIQKKGRHPGQVIAPDGMTWLSKRYKLGERLGEGGTGVVYKAEDLFLDMPVAIKVLNATFTNDKVAVAALKEEARIAMRLSHQHIVHLHNLEKTGTNYFLVMEYIKGSTFRDLLNLYGRLALDTVIQTLKVCSDALSYAHRHGILHNDLKPENLLITEEGVLKIIDFGISCLINTRQEDFIMGTPAYMSPEQIRGEKLDKRTDVYSLGIMTYEFLTGRTPFPDNAGLEDVLRLLPVQLPNVADQIRPSILKAIDPNHDQRWESAETFATAFINDARPLCAEKPAADPQPAAGQQPATDPQAPNTGNST